ncbi:pyocin knob domain-containing protein, partial [Priestia megaterium]
MGITINPKPSTGGGTGEDKELRQQFGQHKDNNALHVTQALKDTIASVGDRYPTQCKLISNWDDAIQNGRYMASNAINAPYADAWFMGIVIVHASDWVVQKLIQFTGDQEFERTKRGGTWEQWVETSPRKLFPSVASGRQEMASALGDKGQPTDANAPFSTFAANIRAIQTDSGGVKPYLNTVNIPAKQTAKIVNI